MELSEIDELRQDNRALRDRLSKLSEASLRSSESLDLNTVLGEVVESARALTGAGSGGIATMDGSGQLEDFVTSGLAPGEHQRFLDLPDGPQLWEYLRQVPQPLRLRDLGSHLASLGFPGEIAAGRTFLGAPIRHRDVHVGNFFLADKEGGQEFTSEDEEILALFASLAGAALANARKYRDEQRARSDLEALIDTSPVGVVVFDARGGRVASFNREAQRIVGNLRMPGRSVEDLLQLLRVRRADGAEIALKGFGLAQMLSEATTIRAEEIVLEVPDGRRVTALVNATAIRAEDGAVESLVVTLQDLTPREELERLRAEFLGMVSHELQAPLVSIKGCAATALGDPAALDPSQARLFFRIVDEQADHMQALIGDLLDAARIETGTLSVAPEPADVAAMVERARTAFLSGSRTNPVRIDLPPDLPRVLADRQRIVQVLGNLLTNAARHSPELSVIRVTAAREGEHVAVAVADEGRGIPAERLPHLFRKFARSGSEDRQRGVGAGLGLAIPRGAHPGRERGGGPRRAVHFHDPGDRGGRRRRRAEPRRRAARGAGVGAGPRGGRRPADAGVRPAHPAGGRLHRAGNRRPGGGGRTARDGRAGPGAAGPDAAGNGRDRAAAARARAGRPAGHLPVGVRPGRDDRQGAGGRGGRLRRQAVLAGGTGGADRRGPAPAGRDARALPGGRPVHPLRGARSDPGGACGGADRHRVRPAGRAGGPRGAGAEARGSAAAGVAVAEQGRRAGRAYLREAAAPQAGRRRERPGLHPHRAPGGLPHARARRRLRALPSAAAEPAWRSAPSGAGRARRTVARLPGTGAGFVSCRGRNARNSSLLS